MDWLCTIAASLLFGVGAWQHASADEVDQARRAVQLIGEYADSICGPLFKEGSQTQLSASADAGAASAFLVRRLVELGISGAAKYENETYIGPPRDQLVAENANGRECRLAVRKDLVHLFRLGDEASSIQNNGSITTGDRSPVVIGTDGDVNITYGE